jgi:glycosyltransferase involved in cell wall biosynthesis
MDTKLKFSIIVPVYNRPNEVEELLESLSKQTNKDFEVVIVEDGSKLKSDTVVEKYKQHLDISYYFKENTGPGISRNYGFERAQGNYCIFLDSDCILPPHYFESVKNFLHKNYVDCFGGPDKAHEDFNVHQKAISYSMTSFFTTGGIRGGSQKMDKFNPRSFNMGFSRDVFEKTGGFPTIRFAKSKAAGEDLDLSIQIKKMGFSTALIQDAYVYHKRRTNLKQFYRQVFNFGFARITISKRHPESLKYLHYLPSLFIIASIFIILGSVFISPYIILTLVLHIIILFFDSLLKTKNISVSLLSIITSYIQILGYGFGFLKAFWKQRILRKKIKW